MAVVVNEGDKRIVADARSSCEVEAVVGADGNENDDDAEDISLDDDEDEDGEDENEVILMTSGS